MKKQLMCARHLQYLALKMAETLFFSNVLKKKQVPGYSHLFFQYRKSKLYWENGYGVLFKSYFMVKGPDKDNCITDSVLCFLLI